MTTIHTLIWWCVEPVACVTGLCVAFWAFRKCRKKGYLFFAAFFVLALYSLLAAPYVNRAIAAHQKPNLSMETEKKLNNAINETTHRILTEAGLSTITYTYSVNFNLGYVLLVAGLWLVAKREKETPNQVPEDTAYKHADPQH